MKLLILGATGRTGRLVTEKALSRGHDVTAFVRTASLQQENGSRSLLATLGASMTYWRCCRATTRWFPVSATPPHRQIGGSSQNRPPQCSRP